MECNVSLASPRSLQGAMGNISRITKKELVLKCSLDFLLVPLILSLLSAPLSYQDKPPHRCARRMSMYT